MCECVEGQIKYRNKDCYNTGRAELGLLRWRIVDCLNFWNLNFEHQRLKLTYLIARCGDGGGGGARAELGRLNGGGGGVTTVARLSKSPCLVMMLMVHPSNEWRLTRPDGL